MQIIVFTKETGKLILYAGPYTRNDNKIVELEGITDVESSGDMYYARANGVVKLRVPIIKTNVIYK